MRQTAWADNRPVFQRLPYRAYQDNPVVDWVTQWIDSYLSDKRNQLENWYLELSPETCQDASLDYLAYLVGYSGEYWDRMWSSAVKRAFIRHSHARLWRRKGTEDAIRLVLDIHGLSYSLWKDGNLTLPFTMPGRFGTPKLRYYVRLPKNYIRTGKEFREARRTVANWSPAIVQSGVCYETFVLGVSVLGDPLFH